MFNFASIRCNNIVDVQTTLYQHQNDVLFSLTSMTELDKQCLESIIYEINSSYFIYKSFFRIEKDSLTYE